MSAPAPESPAFPLFLSVRVQACLRGLVYRLVYDARREYTNRYTRAPIARGHIGISIHRHIRRYTERRTAPTHGLTAGAGGAWRVGVHDDLVLAVSLACWYADRPQPNFRLLDW